MSSHKEEIKLKLAWQTAFELRTCPDSDVLLSSAPDDNLNRHLAICHVCREKREMNQGERDAWKVLRERFATLTMKPGIGTDKEAGQIWTIKKDFGGWRKDGRFVRPPSVLLLEKVIGTSGWQVAQLYSDKRIMASGDVALDDCYGFAEAWNCYSLKDDRFDKCLGSVKLTELKQVFAALASTHEPTQEGSIISFFRRMEIEVGAFVAVPAVVELVEELESAKEHVMEVMPGLKLAFSSSKDFVLDIAAGTLDLLRGTFKPAMILRGGAARSASIKLPDEQKKLIQDHCPVIPINVKLVDHTLTVTLKWLQGQPAESLNIHLFLNDLEMLEVKSIYENEGMVKISCKNDFISTLNQLQTKRAIVKINNEIIFVRIEI